MSDITLVFPPSPFLINQAVFPPLGIMYLSAHLKKMGFDVQCLDMGIGHDPDIAESHTIGISFTTPQRMEAYKLADHYKKLGCKLIAGGSHPTHMPGEVRQHGFDVVIRGYGESLLASVLGTRDSREFNWDFPPDRDCLPLNEYRYEIDGRRATPIMTSRGCRYNCAFCAKMDWKPRIQTSGKVVEEIFQIKEKYGITAFMIFDDVFIIDKDRTRKIAEALENEGFLFRCFGRSDLLDKENCELLKRMGTVEVGLGIESGSDVVLEKIKKRTSQKMNTEAVKNLREVGIRAKAFFIIGLPGETEDTVRETVDWIEMVCPDDLDVTIFQPMPGSDIFNNPVKYGVKFEYDGAQWYKGKPGEYSTTVSTDGLSSERIIYWRNKIERRYKKKELLR